MGLLKETPYRTLAAKIDLHGKYKTPLVLEAELDKVYYTDLWGKLGKITDKAKIKDLIGTEIDLENLLYVFSFKHMDVEPELLQETMIDVHYKLPKSLTPHLASVPVANIPRLLAWPPYADVAAKAVEFMEKGMLAEVEHVFYQCLYSHSETQMLRNPNGLVFVFGYLNLCFKEARDLIALAYGKQLELEDERIQRLLFL
jgi:vacuolar-type H+-ATPase subunit C/Vma6